jgi:hypothetical protein
MEKKVDLGKQCQFVPAQLGAKSFVKGDYDEMTVGGIEENKANQSQWTAFGRKLEALSSK